MQNVIVCLFDVESEGYQAITELRNAPGNDKSFISQAVLIKKENGALKALDSFDTGVKTSDDTAIGGLIGMCVGVLGGPIGMLLGAGWGSLSDCRMRRMRVCSIISFQHTRQLSRALMQL